MKLKTDLVRSIPSVVMSIVDGSFSMSVSDTTIMAHCDADWVEPSTPSDKLGVPLVAP
jgi:hypothetical protein